MRVMMITITADCARRLDGDRALRLPAVREDNGSPDLDDGSEPARAMVSQQASEDAPSERSLIECVCEVPPTPPRLRSHRSQRRKTLARPAPRMAWSQGEPSRASKPPKSGGEDAGEGEGVHDDDGHGVREAQRVGGVDVVVRRPRPQVTELSSATPGRSRPVTHQSGIISWASSNVTVLLIVIACSRYASAVLMTAKAARSLS